MNMKLIAITGLLAIDLQLFRGAVDTGNILQDRRDIDYANEIAELEPDRTPLITITKKSRKRTTTTAEFRWFEDELKPRFDETTDAATDADTTLNVATPKSFTRHDLVKVPRTGEVMLVTAIDDTANTLTVRRGFGMTASAALVDGDSLMIIGSASEENSRARDRNLRQPVRKHNYTGIIKTPVELSGTADAERQRGPQERRRLQRKSGIEHAVDLERMFLYGEPYEDLNSGNSPIRTSGGLLYFLRENVIDFNGSPTEAAFQEAMEEAFRYGSPNKLMVASARWMTVISQWAGDKLRVRPRDKSYGIAVVDYISPHGNLSLVKHHLLEGEEYGGYALILDMKEISYRPLTGRDTKLRENIGERDRDGFLDEYLTEAGFEIRLPKAHAVLTGAM